MSLRYHLDWEIPYSAEPIRISYQAWLIDLSVGVMIVEEMIVEEMSVEEMCAEEMRNLCKG